MAGLQRVCDCFAEPIEGYNAVPFGFGLPLVIRVFPGLLCGDGQNGEIRAIVADLPLLWIFSEEAYELT